MLNVRTLLSWRRLLAMAFVVVLAGAPVACMEFSSSASSRVECHKSKGTPEC